jgi:hypothetical protein
MQGQPLLLAMSGLALIAGGAAAIRALFLGRRVQARRIALALWAGAGVYAAALLAVSLGSEQRVLGPGEQKRFCGLHLDCHLYVSVADVRRTRELGGREARGTFWVVRLKVGSDARRAVLAPRGLAVEMTDGGGRPIARRPDAEASLVPWRRTPLPLDRPVDPGASYLREVVFDVPDDARDPQLLVTEGAGVERVAERFVIGDEDSWLHAPTRIRLETVRTATAGGAR